MMARALAILFFALWLPAPAHALVGQCQRTDEMAAFMEREYKEFPLIVSVTDTERLMTIYAQRDLSQWSMVIAYETGWSCIRGSGSHLKIVDWAKGIKI